jgi:hypothetical protein
VHDRELVAFVDALVEVAPDHHYSVNPGPPAGQPFELVVQVARGTEACPIIHVLGLSASGSSRRRKYGWPSRISSLPASFLVSRTNGASVRLGVKGHRGSGIVIPVQQR